jgi:hypothetical protein
MAEKNESFLDGFMKGLGRKLGARRRQVHESIERFHEELQKEDEAPPKEEKTATSKAAEPEPGENAPTAQTGSACSDTE